MSITPKLAPRCTKCRGSYSLLWYPVGQGQLCQTCVTDQNKEPIVEESNGSESTQKDEKENDAKTAANASPSQAGGATDKKLRKSTRATRFRAAKQNAAAANVPAGTPANSGSATSNANSSSQKASTQIKGRNRRNQFKRTPSKYPKMYATTRTVDSVFHKGMYMQVGDIVSLIDHEDNVYYAQIRGLLVDEYCERSAFLTWLIPTRSSPHPKDGFDPATYLIGPDEHLARKLNYLEYVMHAPSSYYFDRSTPFPIPDADVDEPRRGGYIWTSLPEYRRGQERSDA